jgi:hypothetical protein
MKRVYVVIAGYDYEGYSASSLKVFTLRASAEAYRNEITNGEWPYDHATIMEQEVIEDQNTGTTAGGWVNKWPTMPTGH